MTAQCRVPCYHNATVRRRILAVEPGVNQQTGASLRVGGLLDRLHGPFEVHRITLQELCEGFSPRSPVPERWRFVMGTPAWATSFQARDLRHIHRRLGDHLKGHDLLWLAHGSTAAKLGLDRRAELGVPVILDAYDLLWTALERRIRASVGRAGLRGRRAAMEVTRACRFERRLYGAADQIWVCSELDRRRLVDPQLGPGPAEQNVRVVPNFFPGPDSDPMAVDPPGAEHGPTERPIVFVGTMGYYPNRQGMEWFMEEVWPRVIDRRPSARLWVVGGWPAWAEPGPSYEQPGVEVRGFVEDLDGVWRRAAALVCPLQIGSGTRIKILEAWSHRVPVVSTSVGIEGLEARSGMEARVADDPNEQADALVELLEDPEQRERLATGGYHLWRERYTLDRVAPAAIEGCRSMFETG